MLEGVFCVWILANARVITDIVSLSILIFKCLFVNVGNIYCIIHVWMYKIYSTVIDKDVVITLIAAIGIYSDSQIRS